MPLQIKPEWLFYPPKDGLFQNEGLPVPAVYKFNELILKIAAQGYQKGIIEEYKGGFNAASGNSTYPSSNLSWAESDLLSAMEGAAKNAPVFIKTYYDVSEAIKYPFDIVLPGDDIVNSILVESNSGYKIANGKLLLRNEATSTIEISETNFNQDDRTYELILQSLKRSDKLMTDGFGKEAVQESLWLLETIATGLKDEDTESKKSEAKYFNHIIRDLRKRKNDNVFNNVTQWMMNMHGFLSSPTGGGIRHGIDLNNGSVPSIDEARLYFNLIRSYTYYIYAEYMKQKENNFA